MSPGQSAPDGRGWLRFASLMLMLVGALNVVSGVVALRNHQFLSHKQLLFSDFTVWGWFFVGWGIIQILAGVAIARRVFWAVYVGIVSAFFNVLAQFAYLNTFPAWAILAIAVDVLVIYALVSQGGVFDESADYWQD